MQAHATEKCACRQLVGEQERGKVVVGRKGKKREEQEVKRVAVVQVV